MAAYFKASQLMKGCHLPLLYIGLECGLTNNLKLADKFFQQAQSIAPNDPFVIHETGVISFYNLEYVRKKYIVLHKNTYPNAILIESYLYIQLQNCRATVQRSNEKGSRWLEECYAAE